MDRPVRPPPSIRRYLTSIVVAALLPMGIFAGLLMYYVWDYQQAQRNQEQLERVRAMASMVEGELQSTFSRLRLLASDPDLAEGSLETFHQRLRGLLRENRDWGNLLLVSRERQVLNAAVDFGTSLPAASWPTRRSEPFATGQSASSDLFMGHVRGEPTVAMAVPVVRDGQVAFALVAGLKLGHLGERLAAVVPSDGVAGLFDRSLQFIARTRDPQPYIGQPPGAVLLQAMQAHPEGVIRSVTQEGEGTFTAFRRLADGWYIGVATPSAPGDNAFYRYLSLLGGAWIAMFLLGLLLTRILMARIDENVAATVNAASQLVAGEPVEFPRTLVAELANMSEAVRSLFLRERQARAQVETANQAKDAFLAMLGHELRNPLAPISTALHLMRARADEVFQKERELIERQVQHMVRLVDDLLDVARIARGGVELKKTTVNFAVVVSEAIETADTLFKRKQIALSVTMPEVALKVFGDPVRLSQILSNLLINAAKFTGKGGRVEIHAVVEPQTVCITVCDNGRGMDPTELARVFEPFSQGHQTVDRPHGGLGLGLAIARSLARLHGGDLTATSDGPGQGCALRLILPMVDDPLPASIRTAEPRVLAETDKMVLVVDDNIDAATSLVQLLTLWGFRTKMVHHGSEVIAVLRECSPDVVLLDIGLPGIDGFQVATLIRREPQWHDLQIIALTGYGQANDQERGLQAGIDLYMVKPVDIERLALALGAA